MQTIFSKIKIKFKEFTPKSILCFEEGYTLKNFYNDLFAGIGVGIIALPLALAFAIASGVAPEKGLFTAIVAGFLISLLGGSRVQIGGPTGAFVVLVYSVVTQFGYSGLALATLIAAFLMIFMGIARLGRLLKFIPHPVIVGFTTGIAIVIFLSQVKDFLGLRCEALPPDFIGKCILYFQSIHTWSLTSCAIALASLFILIVCKKYIPKLPGAMIAIAITTLATIVLQLPVETIGSKFGEIPRILPKPALPFFSFDLFIAVFPSALTIAFLGALESLLSAAIADSATGTKHRSNCELIAQGFANIGSVLFGGIPATGAIARTSANIKLGAKTPIAGMIHALTILALMLFCAPLVAKIPLASLAGILVYVAWSMSELPHFIELLKGPKGDALILVTTCILTILIDLTVAIQVGAILSAIVFLKRMTDKTALPILHGKHSSDIAVFEIDGPFFYSVSHLLDDALTKSATLPKIFVLSFQKTSLIDATGLKTLKQFHEKCCKKNIIFLIAAAKPGLFHNSNFEKCVGHAHLFPTVDAALTYANLLNAPHGQ